MAKRIVDANEREIRARLARHHFNLVVGVAATVDTRPPSSMYNSPKSIHYRPFSKRLSQSMDALANQVTRITFPTRDSNIIINNNSYNVYANNCSRASTSATATTVPPHNNHYQHASDSHEACDGEKVATRAPSAYRRRIAAVESKLARSSCYQTARRKKTASSLESFSSSASSSAASSASSTTAAAGDAADRKATTAHRISENNNNINQQQLRPRPPWRGSRATAETARSAVSFNSSLNSLRSGAPNAAQRQTRRALSSATRSHRNPGTDNEISATNANAGNPRMYGDDNEFDEDDNEDYHNDYGYHYDINTDSHYMQHPHNENENLEKEHHFAVINSHRAKWRNDTENVGDAPNAIGNDIRKRNVDNEISTDKKRNYHHHQKKRTQYDSHSHHRRHHSHSSSDAHTENIIEEEYLRFKEQTLNMILMRRIFSNSVIEDCFRRQMKLNAHLDAARMREIMRATMRELGVSADEIPAASAAAYAQNINLVDCADDAELFPLDVPPPVALLHASLDEEWT